MSGNSQFTELAEAIVLQSIKDYVSSYKKLIINPNNIKVQTQLLECENFFLSPWFESLSQNDGKKLLIKLETLCYKKFKQNPHKHALNALRAVA